MPRWVWGSTEPASRRARACVRESGGLPVCFVLQQSVGVRRPDGLQHPHWGIRSTYRVHDVCTAVGGASCRGYYTCLACQGLHACHACWQEACECVDARGSWRRLSGPLCGSRSRARSKKAVHAVATHLVAACPDSVALGHWLHAAALGRPDCPGGGHVRMREFPAPAPAPFALPQTGLGRRPGRTTQPAVPTCSASLPP